MCVVHGVKLHSLGGWELSYTILDLQSLFHVVLPLQLEVGRWINKAIEERLCLICNNGPVEDEEHFLFHCNFYYCERRDFYNYMKNNIPNFNNLSIEQKLQTFMTK